jgi:hypothetical protein
MLGRLLKVGDLVEQPKYTCFPSVAMKKRGVQAIGHEHVGAYPNRNLIITLPMEA